jgi:cell division protein FtsQ
VDTKRTIRKILFVSMWLVIGSGMLVLLIAAMDKQKKELCKGYEIKIKADTASAFFLDKEGVSKLLKASVKGNIKGKAKASFNLLDMEQALERNVWIKDAQLYFDNHAMLHVSVEERVPVARVFTMNGKSFYMDEAGHAMPLSDKTISKVPVFTGFPDKKFLRKEDSVLVKDINSVATYISNHPFWNSQVSQVDIVNGEFEIVPVVGRHIVKFGDGQSIEDKFRRLFAFYQQVSNSVGFDRYKTIDVRFAGQVVGGKSETPKTDSVKLARNVQQMLNEANQIFKEEINTDASVPENSVPGKPLTIKQTPKAVMPSKQVNNN